MSQLHETVTHCLSEIQKAAIAHAQAKVQQIIEVSSCYLSQQNHEKLILFHKLYAEKADEQQTAQLASAVDSTDSIFEQAQALMESGASQEEMLAGIEVDEEKDKERMQLSAFQKMLESIISLEEGIKEKFAPAMSSMQFEDEVRQILEHIIAMFQMISSSADRENVPALTQLAEQMAQLISVQQERELFYRHIFHEAVPEHLNQEDDDFFFNLGA